MALSRAVGCWLLLPQVAAVGGIGTPNVTNQTRNSTERGPVFGGEATKVAFSAWLSTWRNIYAHSNSSVVPTLDDADLPQVFHGKTARTVSADGGAATKGVVTEGMGYAMMVEGMMASQGDGWALDLSLGLARAWLGMVHGAEKDEEPLGGAMEQNGNASRVDSWPYGVSAIPGQEKNSGPAGVATWKFPRKECYGLSNTSDPCHGSATDGDEDAVLGLVYMAPALNYSAAFVDIVIRSIISFASADLGFPDLYRTLPDGRRVYVPKLGSQWGGLTPPGGKFVRERHVPDWCYSPAYFAPAHYRIFRDFAKDNWKPEYDEYLPPHLNGSKTSMQQLADAFDGAILAGYNILYYSSCESGSVSNWVGVKAPCSDNDTLACEGVPWTHTPYVGEEKGNCSASGTGWGMFGSEGSRMPWRVAMDYILYTEESENVRMYGRDGKFDSSIKFNARHYLNRFVTQYKRFGKCDGGKLGDCDCDYGGCKPNNTQAIELCPAFEVQESDKGPTPSHRAPGLVCDNVPHYGQSWWAGFMSWPTFTSFIAPYTENVTTDDGTIIQALSTEEQTMWLESLANLCDFDDFNDEGFWKIHGALCQKNYFHLSQEVISAMMMSGSLPSVKKNTEKHKKSKQDVKQQKSNEEAQEEEEAHDVVVKVEVDAYASAGSIEAPRQRFTLAIPLLSLGLIGAIAGLAETARRRHASRRSTPGPAELSRLIEDDGSPRNVLPISSDS